MSILTRWVWTSTTCDVYRLDYDMRYSEAMEYIEECSRKGIVPGLDSIRQLCGRLGDPQDRLNFIHIAGTNGKGSTLAFISSVLTCSGYRVGRYISPTIRDYRERFQVNGKMISQNMFCELLDEVRAACEEMSVEGNYPTAFEIETAAGMMRPISSPRRYCPS